jgi:NAD(P) transhydrogenase subunit alpha
MTITIAVLKETHTNEPRVAAIPETVKKLTAIGAQVIITKNAGEQAAYPDEDYKQAGASLVAANEVAVVKADVIFCIRAPEAAIVAKMKKGASIIGGLSPFSFAEIAHAYEKAGVTALAMELMPRITRAQNMDILSSQSNLTGYQAVIEAAGAFNRAFPMMMTAAGTIAPAKVFIMGVGVAGLQAIATARRLGASVSATDVRLATKEQVESLGAKFVFVDDEEAREAETAGGYAKEMSAAYKKKQAELTAETIKKQDIVITTALIPGRPAPVLVTEDMVKTMRAGSVIVDLAAPMGGNCPLTEPDKVVVKHGVTIIGQTNMAGHVATDASALFARNLLNFVTLVYDKEKGTLDYTKDEDITRPITLLSNGKPVHDLVKVKPTKAKATPKKKPAKKATAKKTAVKKGK